MDTFKVSGGITDDAGNPLAQALVRFIGSLETLGGMPGAVVSARTAVVWTQEVTGFAGHRWNAYRRFVAGRVAAIPFADFKQQVVEHNPSLLEDKYVFKTEGHYIMPQNDPATLEISWDRTLTGFDGNRWQCWNNFVAGKVIGMTWSSFKLAVVEQNHPLLAEDNYIFRADHKYKLPHHRNFTEYEVATVTSSSGRYVMPDLPAGEYRVEVMVAGRLRSVETLTVTADTRHDIVVVLPALLAAAPPLSFVYRSQGEFRLNNQGFGRFAGVNLPHFLHYGDKSVLQFSQPTDQREMLKKAQQVKARVIRTFLAHHKVSTQAVIDRLRTALGLMNELDMYLLPVFIDLYSNSGAYPDTTDFSKDYRDFQDGSGNRVRLSDAFFRDRYKGSYLGFVKAVVQEFAQHPRILAWEIGNETKCEIFVSPGKAQGDPDQFVAFNLDVARKIKEWDGGRHMVTTGMLCSRHAHMEPRPDLVRKLYGDEDGPIDFITVHAYEQGADVDATWAVQFKRPVLVEEAGIASNLDNFKDRLNGDLKRWFDDANFALPGGQSRPRQHAAGYMLWRFDPLHIGDSSGDLHDDLNIIRDQFAKFV
jgi:hypothetical protein